MSAELHAVEAPPPDEALPPQDLSAERAVLGAAMASADALADVVEIVHGGVFYRPAHEVIWGAIAALSGRGEPVDLVTVHGELNRTGDVGRIGGPAYLHTLVSSVVTVANAGYHARNLVRLATLRGLVTAGQRITHLGFSPGANDVTEVVNTARAELDTLAAGTNAREQSLSDIADAALDSIGVVRAVPTPWQALNDVIDGWEPGWLYLLGARPSVGKTLVAVQAAVHAALQGRSVAYFTFEMSAPRLYQRALANLSSVSQRRMRIKKGEAGALTDAEWRAVAKADGELRPQPLHIVDAQGRSMTAAQVKNHARTLHRRHPLSLILVDHLGLVTPPPGAQNREREVSQMSWAFQQLSRELDVPVVLLSQLSRESEKRQDKRPQLSDLRDSGSLEQDADVVLMLHRDVEKSPDELQILVAKNRDGQTGPLAGRGLMWEGECARVSDWKWSPSHAIRGPS